MATPRNEVIQFKYQNPHATNPLIIPLLVLCNTSDEDLERNIRSNSVNYTRWLKYTKPHDGVAIMVGGGPSANDHVEEIRSLKKQGGKIFAMNAASKWCREHGLEVDYQVILDAKEETAQLVDPEAKAHLFASQCNPKTLSSVPDPTLWHLEIGEIEKFLPDERVKRGGYVLLGGGAAAGNSALCVAYAMGFREMHIFGYDSSHRNGESHAYSQPMNAMMPTVEVTWAGKTFQSSVAMKAQAEKFQITAQALKQDGCKLHVYGDGLLQTMYHASLSDLSEREKYQLMWQYDSYRDHSPGEQLVDAFIELAKPEGTIIDFGCGTGRAALALSKKGYEVIAVDFADNCRDEEALTIPFIQWDLTMPCPARANFGFCTDVLEHIPTNDVDSVIRNIMDSSKNVFFQISTVDDAMGDYIGKDLHLTVKPHSWWRERFNNYIVPWELETENASLFLIVRGDA